MQIFVDPRKQILVGIFVKILIILSKSHTTFKQSKMNKIYFYIKSKHLASILEITVT